MAQPSQSRSQTNHAREARSLSGCIPKPCSRWSRWVPLRMSCDNEADRHRRQDAEPGAGRAEQPRPMRSTVEVGVESGISDDEAAMIVDEELFLDETQPAEEAGGRRHLIERRPLSSERDLRDMRSSAPREARFAAANVASSGRGP